MKRTKIKIKHFLIVLPCLMPMHRLRSIDKPVGLDNWSVSGFSLFSVSYKFFNRESTSSFPRGSSGSEIVGPGLINFKQKAKLQSESEKQRWRQKMPEKNFLENKYLFVPQKSVTGHG